MGDSFWLGIAIGVYLVVLFAIGLWARGRIHDASDYIVAGRRLPFFFSTGTLLATWFGAGIVLATTDEVRESGLQNIALEPIGPGLCLVFVALFFARPMWNARLLTHNDLYARRYGKRVEILSSLYAINFVPWISAQLLGMAGILRVYFELPLEAGIVLVAFVALGYTLLGGMWSVTITDAFQLVLILLGLVWLLVVTLAELGGGSASAGWSEMLRATPPEDLEAFSVKSTAEMFEWLSLFLAGTIGIIPSQDLMQRVFAARSARVAVWSSLTAGLLYLAFGAIPVVVGLASRGLLDVEIDSDIVAELGRSLMGPVAGTIFVLAILSAVLSTIDSALLAPASVFAQNFLRHVAGGRVSVLALTRLAAIGIAAASSLLALSGNDAFAFLEESYSMGLAPFVVLVFAVYQKTTRELPALLALSFGLLAWLAEILASWRGTTLTLKPVFGEEPAEIPSAIVILVVSFSLYVLGDLWERRR